MKFYILCLSIVLFSFNNLTNAQIKNKIILPFDIIEDHLVVHLEANGEILNLIFDIASNVSMIDSAKAKELNLTFGLKTQYNNVTQYYTDFDIGEPFSEFIWLITDFEQESRRINYRLDGLIGADSLIKMSDTEVDFENKKIVIGAQFNASYDSQIFFDISSANKATKGLGVHFPKSASITDTIQFNSSTSKKMDLIVDTGCKYGFAFIGKDSTLIDSLLLYFDDYSLFNNTERIGFTSARSNGLESNYHKSPLFFRPDDAEIMNNNFYGLLGVPILKKFDKIFFDWSNDKIFFIRNSQN
jgi:hypothetical protein